MFVTILVHKDSAHLLLKCCDDYLLLKMKFEDLFVVVIKTTVFDMTS